jgi:ribonucleoside-diphosphate reductase alpha chain
VRIRNVDHALNFDEMAGFIGERKSQLVVALEPERSAKKDYVSLPADAWAELAPAGHPLHSAVTQSLRKNAGVPRMVARRLFEETLDARLEVALGYLFERVESNEDGGVQPTYDLSVPANVTYVANGMVSHNTIGLMMDCDTTGVEPDLALVKFKKLVGGGSMQIVNQTVPRALKSLGYQPEQVEAIVEYIAEHGHVVDAPGMRPEHYEVFDCAMGERSISPMGHVRMMAAVQPGLSGAISKTVNLPESATAEDIESIYLEGWKLGLKALAVYRDNCKVGQPLSVAKRKQEPAATPVQPAESHPVRPVRRRLPKRRPANVTRFSVAGAEGYMTASTYPDDGLGEVFLKLGKQGSTLAGVMDAFSVAISISLQYGVPLEKWVEKFTNMRFEPAGVTDDPDIRIASSVMDYVFRRLALDYLPYETRAEMGILSAAERAAQLAGEDPAALAEDAGEMDTAEMAQSAPRERPQSREAAAAPAPAGEPAAEPHSSVELLESHQGRTADAPLCLTCGTKMRPAGSCYVCEGCGATSGCS